MHKLPTLFAVFFVSAALGQNAFLSPPPSDFRGGKVMLSAESEFSANSTALNNHFMRGFLDGGTLSPETQEAVLNRSGNRNRFGMDFNSGVTVAFSPEKFLGTRGGDLVLTAGIADRTHINSLFSGDFTHIMLYGNREFAGREADLSEFTLDYLQYSQVRLGVHHRYAAGSRYGVTAAFNIGEGHVSARMPYGRLYTSPEGDEIRLNALAELQYSDTSNTGIGAVNGAGFSVDIYHETEINLTGNRSNKGVFRIMVNDLGFIRWNENSVRANVDTLYRFTGTPLGSFPVKGDTSYSSITPDSIVRLLTEDTENESYYKMLPMWIRVSLYQDFGKYDAAAGLDLRPGVQFLPYVYTHVRYQITRGFKIGTILGAGGFGTGNFGFSLSYDRAKWDLSIASQNAEGLIFQGKSGGSHGYVKLRRFF